jgi:hypothetical protein
VCHGTGKVGGLTDSRSRAAVEVAERYADEGESVARQIGKAWLYLDMEAPHEDGWVWAAGACSDDLPRWLGEAMPARDRLVPPATQAALLRCVFGNPWRPVMRDPWISTGPERYRQRVFRDVWLSWNGGTVVKLARKIYDERDWSGLGVLADALEEAGCADEDILHHLRGERRCGGCLGEGKISSVTRVEFGPSRPVIKSHPGTIKDMFCTICSGVGWVKAGPHCRGDWCLDLLLEKS